MGLSKWHFAVITSRPYWYVYIIGVLLLLISGWLWWSRIFMSPERVFWDMLHSSLSTRSVTMELSQSDGESAIHQVVQTQMGTTGRAHSLTTLKQGDTEVKTEIIGTRDTDYTRYRSIDTDQKNAEGKPLDVSKVVNVWAKSDSRPQSGTQAAGHQLLAQSLLGIGLPIGSVSVPIGQLTPEQREDLLREIRDKGVYRINFDTVKKERKDGRMLYSYDAEIQTILYVRMMKQFAKDLGFSELDQVNPNEYQSNQKLKVRLTIDTLSRQLVGADNATSGYKQTYKGYGLPLDVALPKQAITSAELQQRLTQL